MLARPPPHFTPPPTTCVSCDADVVAERLLSDPPGIRITPVEHSGLGVLTLAGSSGRVDTDRARLFAHHGALAESIQWFGGPDQHPGPWEIPLELFQARVSALRRTCDHILVAGTSFGSEAALLTGAHTTEVDAVVAFAPSDVVWAGVTPDGRQTSHWTMAGRPLPFVPFLDDWRPAGDPPAFRTLYELSRAADPRVTRAAAIPAERIRALILVAGRDDLVWPSAVHAQAIADRRSRHSVETTLVFDPAAGHRTVLPGEPVVAAGAPLARGGSPEADRRLGEAAWRAIRRLMADLAGGARA
jgi:dienelactone hydrolase